MPGLDPNIVMGGQLPQIQNPMDNAVKAMTLKDAYLNSQIKQTQNQQIQQEYSDSQAMRSALANNTKVDQDGNPTVDRGAMLKELGQTAPSTVAKASLQFAQQDQQIQAQKLDIMRNNWSTLGQMAGAVNPTGSNDPKDMPQIQQNYQNFLKQASQLKDPAGRPVDTSQFPQTYDPNVVNRLQVGALNADQQIKKQQEQQGLNIRNKEADIKTQELALSLKKNQAEQTQQTLQSLQSARGNPAVQRAEMDIYSNSKVNKLVAQGVDKNGKLDPNQLNGTQLQLMAGEVGKIATGGAPTLEELHGLTPNNVPQWLAKSAENYKNKPTAANAGAFVNQLQKYSNGVAEDAKDLLKENYQGILEAKKPWLDQGSYNTLNQQFIGRLSGEAPPGDWSLRQGKGPGSGGGSAPAPGGTAAPGKGTNTAGIHPALQGKTLEELLAMKAQKQNAGK